MSGSGTELIALSPRGIADAQALTRKTSEVPHRIRLLYQDVMLAAKKFVSAQCFNGVRNAQSGLVECLDRFEQAVEEDRSEELVLQLRTLRERAREIGDSVLVRYGSICAMRPIVEPSLLHPDERCKLDSGAHLQVELRFRIRNAECVAPPPTVLTIEIVGRPGRGGTQQIEMKTGQANEFYACMRAEAKIEQADWIRGSMDLSVKWTVACELGCVSGDAAFVVPFACPTTEEDLRLYGEDEAEGTRFVGRKATLEAIMAGIRSETGFGVLVTGQRKTGKSSLLKKIEELSGDDFPCLRATLYGSPRYDEAGDEVSPQVRILECLEKKMRAGDDRCCQEDKGLSIDSRWSSVRAWKHAGKRLVLLIDEFQEIYHNYRCKDSRGRTAVDEVVATLRTLVTEYGIRVIIAAQDSIQNFTEAANILAPFRKVRTNYLSEHELGELVGLMSVGGGEFKRVDVAGVHWIYNLTGGNPYFTQKFCSRLVHSMRVTDGMPPFASEAILENVERELVDPDAYETALRPDDFESFFGLGLYDRSGKLMDDAELLELYCRLANRQDVGRHKILLSKLRIERFIIDSHGNCKLPLFMKWLARQPIDELAPEMFCRRDG